MNPSSAVLLQQGLDAFTCEDYEQAQACFNQLIASDPTHDQAWYKLIQSYLFNHQIEHALARAEQACQIFPHHAVLLHLHATCLQQAKHLPAALNLYRQALSACVDQSLPREQDQAKPTASFDSSAHEALLWQTLIQLANAGIYAFATSGTLLGLVREKRLLPFDKDIDIGLPFEQMSAAIRCIEAFGWREVHHSYGLINPRCFRHPSGLILDLCGYGIDLDTGEVIGGMWMDQVPMSWNRVTRYPTPVFKKQAKPEGVIWRLKQPQDFLSALYGDWQQPDADFDTVICAHNLRGFSLLTQCFAFSRLFHLWRQGKRTKYQRILQCCLGHLPQDALLLALQSSLTKDDNHV